MRVLIYTLLAITLSGCMITDRPGVVEDAYSRAEIDALAARRECRAMARSMVAIARCEGR